ncbi:MAG: WecB/TagA/CpsF family glycosyltransferase [Ardenticatenaceae bacterium]|nr:WecB/TagA/CpsF family glycosyltransferase [Ardenticatenaceae bacterium]MCB9444204.1 WecB/TagA/CpsF family glycosyltransferase [Ardenticatenaceae bacterium]
MKDERQSLTILNTPVHAVTMAETLARTQKFMAESRLHQICTTNPEFVMAAQTDDAFRQILWQADLCLPDGIGLVVASRWLKKPLPERVPGSELVYHLAELCAQEGWRLFLLGAAPGIGDAPGIAEEAAAIFQSRYPDLIIAGTYAGSPDPAENEAILKRINDSGAEMLFVAYGAPKQDKWIARNREALPTVRMAIGIGGSLDFVTGKSIRAPRWVQNLGLEWLHRLIKEPWRWRRMLALPRFVLAVVVGKLGSRGAGGQG